VTPEKPKLVLADDNAESLRVWCELLRPSADIVATANDGNLALEAICHFKPDLAVLDLSMPGLNGIEVTRQALAGHPDLRVIICSVEKHPSLIHAAATAGARGYVFKNRLFDDLATAVATIASGGEFFPPNE